MPRSPVAGGRTGAVGRRAPAAPRPRAAPAGRVVARFDDPDGREAGRAAERRRLGGMGASVAVVLVVSRFDVPDDASEQFLADAQAALTAFAARPGYVRGRVGRAADDPTAWVLTTEWEGIGAYRRSLSGYDVKVAAAPLLARARPEPSAFEVLLSDEGSAVSGRAADAGTVGVGEAAGGRR